MEPSGPTTGSEPWSSLHGPTAGNVQIAGFEPLISIPADHVAPPLPAFDLMTTTAFASLATSKRMPPEYALPRESQAPVGSLHASAVCPSSSWNCQNGGTW